MEHLDQFWAEVAEWSGVLPGVPDDEVLTDRSMPGAVWFPGRTVNYAEQALRHATDEHPALIATAEDADPVEISWATLRGQVGAFAATLRGLGVQPGDRVAGYLPNVPEAVVAFLGAASIGAVWSSCAPDFGTRAVLDRFAQIEPSVLVAVDGYRFNGKDYDRRDVVAELRAALPTVRTTIAVPRLFPDDLPGRRPGRGPTRSRTRCEPEFAELPFDHPLWIVYSSGTTGLPKGIVHGHGGVVLEQRKKLGAAPRRRRRATASSGTPRPPGSCGTSRRRRCSSARPWSSTTAPRRIRGWTRSSRSPPAPASPTSAPAPAT